MNVVLCYDKKESGPQAQLSPSEVQSWLRGSRSHLEASWLPLLRKSGTQSPNGHQAPQAAQKLGPGPVNCILCRLLLPLDHRGGDGGEVHHHLKDCASPVGSLGQGWSPQDTALSLSLGNLLPTRLEAASLRLGEHEGPRKNARICLLPHSPPNDHHSANSWLNSLSNGCSLTVGGLWEGSLERQPMVERDLLPGNRVGRNGGLVPVLR